LLQSGRFIINPEAAFICEVKSGFASLSTPHLDNEKGKNGLQ
jgi:hypothetical protein